MNKKKIPVPIYLIRHGEAESSWDQDSNPGLSKKGKRQSLVNWSIGKPFT